MDWGRLKRLDGLLAGVPFDVVHIPAPFLAHYSGLRLARSRGLPVVTTYHTMFEEYLYHYVPLAPKRLLRGLAQRFSRSHCNALDAVVVPSGPMRDMLTAHGVPARMAVTPTRIRSSSSPPATE